MDRLSPREGGHGDMMPPPYVHFNQVMVDYFDSDDAPVSVKLQRPIMSSISLPLPHHRLAAGQVSENAATPDSAYGTNSVRGKPSTGRRSLYDGSNASSMSTVARLDVGAILLDTQSEASQPRSEYATPVTGDARKWTQGSVQGYVDKMTPDDPWDSGLTAMDTADMFSMPDINDCQSVNGGPDMLELHCFPNEKGYNCTICPKDRRKVTKTRSEMFKHLRKHLKPFKCNVAGCKMALTGFATDGDLKRHHTSCHKDIRTLSEFFMCYHGRCKEKRKPWTRWDNMKKHIFDLHGIKAENREHYRVKNNGPQESDLAGIGLPSETDRAKSPAPDADASAIDLLDGMSELDQLMAKPVPNVSWTSTSPPGSLSYLGNRNTAPTRIMPSQIRSIRSNPPSENFEPLSARPPSPSFSITTPPQISSTAALPGPHRRSGFLSTSHRPSLAASPLDQRRLQHRMNPWISAYLLPDGHDALLGQHVLSKLPRPRAPAASMSPKRDLHRLYPDRYGLDAIQQMQTSFDRSALFQYRQDPWTPESYLALHRSAGKVAPVCIDNDDTEDPEREIHLDDELFDEPIDTGNHSDGDCNENGTDSVDVVAAQEDNDEQRPQQLKKSQKESQESKGSQESQETRELQEPQGPMESQQELQEAQEPQKDNLPRTESYIDLTEPDVASDHGPTDEATTFTDAVVLDDVMFDSLSDDRLQTVLKRLKRLDDAGGRLESLGYRLVEVPVTPAKRSVRSEHTATKEAELYPCPQNGCSASFVNKSSLRKHEKRHERPFACTFGCVMKYGEVKVFGSKNDWKRHEESLHFKEPVAGEEWQCGEMMATVDKRVRIPCGGLFRSAATYQQHLISQHNHLEADKKTLRETMARYRAVPAGKCSYWCGFCKEHIRVTARAPSTVSNAGGGNSDSNEDGAKNAAAEIDDANDDIGKETGPATKHRLQRDGYTLFSEILSERFNHIDKHFVGRGERKMDIAQWVPDDTHRPKSNVVDEDMVRSLNRHSYHDDDTARRKRHRGDDRLSGTKRSKSSGRKATKRNSLWICCRCNGVNTAATDVMCSDCQHAMCDKCTPE